MRVTSVKWCMLQTQLYPVTKGGTEVKIPIIDLNVNSACILLTQERTSRDMVLYTPGSAHLPAPFVEEALLVIII